MTFSAQVIACRESSTIQARGKLYCSRVQVIQADLAKSEIVAHVFGTRQYTTSIRKNPNGTYSDNCTCSYGATCKHSIALAYVVEADPKLARILDEEGFAVKGQEELKDHELPKPVISSWLSLFEAAPSAILEKQNEAVFQGLYYRLLSKRENSNPWEQEEKKDYLYIQVGKYKKTKSSNILSFASSQDARILYRRNPAYLTDLDRKILAIIAFCQEERFFYYSYDYEVPIDNFAIGELLNLLPKTPVLLFGKNSSIRIYPNAVDFVLECSLNDGHLTWKPRLRENNQFFAHGRIVRVYSYHPPIIQTEDNVLFTLNGTCDTKAVTNLLKAPAVSEKDLKNEEIINGLIEISQRYPLSLPKQWLVEAQAEEPKPIVIINATSHPWEADLFFQYGSRRFQSMDQLSSLFTKYSHGQTVIFKRDREKEEAFIKQAGAILKMKDALTFPLPLTENQKDCFFNKIIFSIPQEWEVWFKDERYPVNRGKAKFNLTQTSGIDWLDVSGAVHFDDTTIPLMTILDEILHEIPMIEINGRRYLLEEKLFETLKRLQGIHDKNGTLRLGKNHIGILDSLNDIIDESQLHASWRKSLLALRTFSDIKQAPMPAKFRGVLRDYQHHGINWLHFLRNFGFGGILADDMGLGKTVQALVMLAYSHQQLKEKKLSLIVSPTSVVYNWFLEMKRFTPTLRPYMYTRKDRQFPEKGQADVILTSYAYLWRDREKLAHLPFHYIILDESQYIKNHASQTAQSARSLAADHKLSLTGTPLENNLLELWSQFAFVAPGMFDSLDSFKEKYVQPIERNNNLQVKTNLQQLIKPFILRRKKEDVLKELPAKIEQTVWCEMEPSQKELYEVVKTYYKAKVSQLLKDKGLEKSHIQILEALLRLRQICCHPLLLRLSEKESFMRLPEKLKIVDVSVKLDTVMELVETAIGEDHKVFLFSQFVSMLDILRDRLKQKRIPTLFLSGETKNRQEIIAKFQEGNVYPMFLLSLKAGGTGLNLTAADYVIHYDPWWNPAVEAQATDRAHRIGQKRTVYTYKLLVKDTIEEKVQKLQEKKKDLIDSLITASEGPKHLTKEDIVYLFG